MISHYSASGIYHPTHNNIKNQLNISEISHTNNSKMINNNVNSNNEYTDKDYYLETSSKVDVSLISSNKNGGGQKNNAFATKHMSFSNLG